MCCSIHLIELLKYGPCVNMWKTRSSQIQGASLSAQVHFIPRRLIFLWVLSMELTSCYRTGIYSFEVAHRLKENLKTPGLKKTAYMLHIHYTDHSAIMPRQQSLFIRLSRQNMSVYSVREMHCYWMQVLVVYLCPIWERSKSKALQLLYSRPTHALLLNTLSHPHFKTLKLLKNVL
jgi:hypothetical protein